MRATLLVVGRASVAVLICCAWTAYASQQPEPEAQQPPPFTAPNPPTPDAAHAPGQHPVPEQQQTPALPQSMPMPDKSMVDLRNLAPLSSQPELPAQPSSNIRQFETDHADPKAETPSNLEPNPFKFLNAYRAPHVPRFSFASPAPFNALLRDGKLYLSLHDAIVLAIENNLDVEVSRYNLLFAETDLKRAKGGGNLRGLDYTVTQMAPGVGAQTSPLLITATTTGTASPTSINVTDLSQVTQIGASAPEDLSQNGGSTYSPGPNIPLFDPVISAEGSYLRRSDQDSLIDLGGSSGTTSSTTSGPLDYFSAGIDYQQGFSSGAQLDLYTDNASQVLYADNSQYDPAHSPSSSATLVQPLLRGRGREVNLRFVRIAQLDRRVSRLIFEQQLLETVYGISRLYYDLVSLGENVGVKQESLKAAQKLYDDDKNQVDQGTLAPIELMRAQALLSSSRLDLIQAEGEYRQQEVILREQIIRQPGPPGVDLASIVPTDRILVPDSQPSLDVPALIKDALTNRPDFAQAGIQVKADEIAEKAARNNVKPLLNLYANVQARGSSLVPYTLPGSPGTGVASVPPALFEGGLRVSTIYQGGLQLNLPLRNRIAQADSARDSIQLRQAEGRTAKLENDIRQQIENAAIALETAHQAYAAAVESRNYQQQLLQAEIDKFAVGESTNYLIIQDEAYLAQARSTEVAARSDWMKAKLALDRSLGSLLEKNGIEMKDAIEGTVH